MATGALMVLMILVGTTVVPPAPPRSRPAPWAAIALTALAIAGVALQLAWTGAMDTLDSDPARAGWWRPVTSAFLQNGGVIGGAWNLVTLAVILALAEWRWGSWLTVALFLLGALLPRLVGTLGGADAASDPRNFAGSSGATYFVGGTLAAALVLAAGHTVAQRALALTVPGLALLTWLLHDNAHGLVTLEGFVVGIIVWALVALRDSLHAARRAGP
jgi:hypothetical protein